MLYFVANMLSTVLIVCGFNTIPKTPVNISPIVSPIPPPSESPLFLLYN